ncbi:MAG TPA: carbon monoxide dehydrogenase subunit G [Ramlibacter sp.]
MELNGEVAINAPRERVWAALNDARVLQACIPGCEEVVDESPTVRKARVMVKVGPVRARFNGTVKLSEVDAPGRCVMGFEGSGGAAGMASGRSQVELHAQGEDTRLTYTVKAAVGGKLGQIGGRMIDASAKQLADQFFEALRLHLSPQQPEAAVQPAEAVGAPAAPTAAVPAALPAPTPARAGEGSRILWFLLGAGATAFGVWLGKVLF